MLDATAIASLARRIGRPAVQRTTLYERLPREVRTERRALIAGAGQC